MKKRPALKIGVRVRERGRRRRIGVVEAFLATGTRFDVRVKFQDGTEACARTELEVIR